MNTEKNTAKNHKKPRTPSMASVYAASLDPERLSDDYGPEEWGEVSQLLGPIALAEQAVKLFKKFEKSGLADHPECREVYEAIYKFNQAQVDAVPAKLGAMQVLRARTVRGRKLAN